VKEGGVGILQRGIVDSIPVEVAYDQSIATLDYAALDFGPGNQISYAYRLSGLETDWNEVADRRSVTYADLSPGDYTFEVRAARSGRNWGPVTKLGITVLPPPWATPWAYCLYTGLVIGLLYAYRFVLKRRNELRNRIELAELSRSMDAEVAESKANFFTNVTHELRTPLTLVAGPVSELLASTLAPRQHEMLQTVDRNVQRLLMLCNQLLDFRKVESEQLQLRAARGNFVPFVHEVTLSFREAARQQGIRLVFDCAQEELPLTYDRNQLEIVLCNLLSNSLKYAPAGTDVTVSLVARDEQWVTLSVSDQGPGISPELAEKVFDRYYQIANTESSQLVGTGIGLALTRGIVRAHHGIIGVVSTPGRGSTFTVELRTGTDHFDKTELLADFRPSDAPEHYLYQASQVSPRVEVVAEPDAPEILIVEDNAEIRGFLVSLLRPHYRLREAEDGRRALEMATENPPDLVLSDVMMPVLDGIRLCGALRDGEATGHLPIVLLTARTSTVHQIQGYGQGADAYITKPFDAAVLLVRIETLLKQRRDLKQYYASRVTLSPTETSIPDADREWLEAAIAYIEEHIDRSDLSRNEVAGAMAMSDSTFYRRLKAVTGQTWGGFVRSLRIMRAAQLLRQGKYSVADAAYQTGFSDLKHFRHCFREQFGKSPAEYRRFAPASPPN
jgi:signal transduction histidine kinase/DNA-binding response OmpR family regulator